jgi:SAM-dependent methyltransferase
MTISDKTVKALHLEGGNYFDDMRIDISESHRRFVDLDRNTASIHRSKYRNLVKLYLTGVAMRLGIYEFLIVNGIRKKWLDDFRSYWSDILNGRPFWNTMDFFMLLHDYRKRQQYTSQLDWGDPAQHLANWQNPNQIYSTLHNVRVLATRPIVGLALWKRVPKSARILEYGCSLAPYYHCYRDFFSHLDCKWTLADIPNFPIHYARYLYSNDADVEFVIINANDFSNPLGEVGEFDVIILTTVFEHLDDPLFLSEYLLKRLKIGGLFVFDYIKSEGKGLDHPKALEMRQDCIRNIMAQTDIVSGKINNIKESIGLCIAQKKIA